jgi:hypothetical protein
MTFTDWVPALTTSAILAALGTLAGVFAKALVERGIQHGLDRELEKFKAELRGQDDKIAALRSGALSGLATRQAALDQRRALAVERLWAAVIDLGRLKFAATTLPSLNLDEIFKLVSAGGQQAEKMSRFAGLLLTGSGVDENTWVKYDQLPDKEQPFLDPLSWALFSAYRQVLSTAALILLLIKTGHGRDMLKDDATLSKPIRAALPGYDSFLDEHGLAGMMLLVQPLEEKLLEALRGSLEGKATDQQTIKQAGQIIAAVAEASKEQPMPPAGIPAEVPPAIGS